MAALPFAYDLLRGIGGLDGEPPTLRQAQARGQLTVTELVDRYAVACRPVRDVLVHYLAERSAVLDYRSLDNQAHMLVSLFWADLERHHPGIDTLHLGGDVAHGWKQRVRTLPDGTPRRTFHAVLLSVRSFYLDLLQWSLEDPARWAAWAAPCPVSETDVRGYIKEARRRRARMAERTRALAPVLPRLVAAAGAFTLRPAPSSALVTTGVYARARHPIYGGWILVGLGFALALSPWALLLAALLALELSGKSRVEERALVAHHPEYTAYRQRVTRRFFPLRQG